MDADERSRQKKWLAAYEERNRKHEEWREANKDDIARRVAKFRLAYDKIVEECRIRITSDGSGTYGLEDIDQKDGWVADFDPWPKNYA